MTPPDNTPNNPPNNTPNNDLPATAATDVAGAGAFEWPREWMPRFLGSLRSTPNVSMACRRAGIHPVTAYRWRDRDEAFRAEWDAAAKHAADMLLELMQRRATVGETVVSRRVKRAWYTDPGTGLQVYGIVEETVTEENRVSDTLAAMFLKAYHRDLFAPPSEVTLHGGEPIRFEHDVYRVPTRERVGELLDYFMAENGLAGTVTAAAIEEAVDAVVDGVEAEEIVDPEGSDADA